MGVDIMNVRMERDRQKKMLDKYGPMVVSYMKERNLINRYRKPRGTTGIYRRGYCRIYSKMRFAGRATRMRIEAESDRLSILEVAGQNPLVKNELIWKSIHTIDGITEMDKDQLFAALDRAEKEIIMERKLRK
jgi:hypothetical protein